MDAVHEAWRSRDARIIVPVLQLQLRNAPDLFPALRECLKELLLQTHDAESLVLRVVEVCRGVR